MVVLDDLDKQGVCLSHYLKIWLDRYPSYGEIKGGTVPLNYNLFIITSNYLPSDLWPEDAVLCSAIERRCVFREFRTAYQDVLQQFLEEDYDVMKDIPEEKSIEL